MAVETKVRTMPEIGKTRKQARRIQAGKHSEHHNHRPTRYISYCPFCDPIRKVDPETAPRVGVQFWKKHGKQQVCPNNPEHIWITP